MLSEETVSIPGISLNELFCVSTAEFLRPFEDVIDPDIHKDMYLDFQINDRTHTNKITPILRLARPEDAKEIVEIYKELYNGTYPYEEMEDEQEVRKMIQDPTIQWIIYQDPSFDVAGCITFVLDFENKRGYIRGFMLKKEYQGYIDITKAMIGSMIGMCHKYKNEIYTWYVENRTAHAKSQYSMRVCGIAPIGFYPNKDIFLGNIESDVMQILYDERVLRQYRRKKPPQIIPEVIDCYRYSDARYKLGEYNIITPHIRLDFKKVSTLKKKVIKKVKKDKFGYETIYFSFPGSDSFFRFLYTPNAKNFEKTEYKVENLEELYVFIQEFMKCKKELNVRYLEVFLSAYHPRHQQIFFNAGLSPRGYIPSWKYNPKLDRFDDYILFNYFEGLLNKNIQLIKEVWNLIDVISITPNDQVQDIKHDNNSFFLSPKPKGFKLQIHNFLITPKVLKSCLMTGLLIYLSLLLSSIFVAFLSDVSHFTITSHAISALGSKQFTPLPFLFNFACIIGGATMILLNFLLFRQVFLEKSNQFRRIYINYEISKLGLIFGIAGNVGYIFVGIFSLDRAGSEIIIHGSFAGLAFSGFVLSIFSFSVCILFNQTNIPKFYGILGISPLGMSILYCIFLCPLIEWILLFTILISLIPLFFWIKPQHLIIKDALCIMKFTKKYKKNWC